VLRQFSEFGRSIWQRKPQRGNKKSRKKNGKKTDEAECCVQKAQTCKSRPDQDKISGSEDCTEKGFSKEDLAHFKGVILAKRQEILEELESLSQQ